MRKFSQRRASADLPRNTMRQGSDLRPGDSAAGVSQAGQGRSQVVLGGTDCKLGEPSSMFRKIANDNLLCLKCMCRVVRFENVRWNEEVADYMFFRNYWPEPERLYPGFVEEPGSAAYCCQCSWVTVSKLCTLESCSGGLEWCIPSR